MLWNLPVISLRLSSYNSHHNVIKLM
ncbi:hypothetical protein HKBW3S42_02299, partial [Candidatus Hakubella thermalkaliphila]